MKTKKAKIKDINETISEMSRLMDGLYDKAEGLNIIVKNLDRISTNIEILKINISDMAE
jgi:hypothetical protein